MSEIRDELHRTFEDQEAKIAALEAWASEADSMLARAHSEIAWADATIRSYSNKMPGGKPPEIMAAISELRGRLTDIVESASGRGGDGSGDENEIVRKDQEDE